MRAPAAIRRLPVPLQAGLLMMLASSTAALMNVLIRHTAVEHGIHAFEIAFFRNLFGFAFMLPFLGGIGLAALRPRHLGTLGLSSVGHVISMLCFFYAVVVMPIADATALIFTKPLFATVGAALILGEVVRARRWTATLLGFIGVVIILRPGSGLITPEASLPLISAMVFAGVTLMIKHMTNTIPTITIVFYQSLMTTLISAVPAALVWVTPSWTALGLMVVMGFLGTLGWLCFTRAFSMADATAVLPYDFIRLPLTALLAFMMFGEATTIWLWVGGTVIFCSSVYITHRESRAARHRVAAAAAAGAVAGTPATSSSRGATKPDPRAAE